MCKQSSLVETPEQWGLSQSVWGGSEPILCSSCLSSTRVWCDLKAEKEQTPFLPRIENKDSLLLSVPEGARGIMASQKLSETELCAYRSFLLLFPQENYSEWTGFPGHPEFANLQKCGSFHYARRHKRMQAHVISFDWAFCLISFYFIFWLQ